MKLIVEAGSTKTESVLLKKDGTISAISYSPGINPVTDPDYIRALSQLADIYKTSSVHQIYYYGSGCVNKTVNDELASHLINHLEKDVEIEVRDDLIAVGRGMCQEQPGIVVIIGTGSNIGFYDGHRIIDGIRSCGYLLGDEGSGYCLGRAIYTRFARSLLTAELENEILEKFQVSKDQAVTKLYALSNPRQFLASFAQMIHSVPTTQRNEIFHEVFDPFVDNMIRPMMSKYNTPLYLSGSIAYNLAEALQHKFQKINNIAASFAQSPLKGLTKYHQYE